MECPNYSSPRCHPPHLCLRLTYRDVLDLDLDVALSAGRNQDLGGAVGRGVDLGTEARSAADAGTDALRQTHRQVTVTG